jgi:hypothetical protein
VDQCPAVAGTPPTGCDTTPATITIAGAARRMTRKRFLKRGVRARLSANEGVALEVALLGKARRVSLARATDVVLAEKKYRTSTATRRVRLKAKRRLVGPRRRFTVRLRVIATDAAGNRSRKTRTIRVR